MNQDVRPSKTLWDWLKLLIVPAVLAVGGYLFTRSENIRALEIANQQAEDSALQAYLDQMSTLLLEKGLLDPKQDSEVATLARARTLTILNRLEGERRGTVVQFLHESGLITIMHHTVVSVEGANLRGARLDDLMLSGVDLRKTHLESANLTWANLSGARLDDAQLARANLENTSLDFTSLDRANLEGARLARAGLAGASLSWAELKNARGVTNEHLDQWAASLNFATMPNGQKYEDWLKSKDRKKDGKDE